jgi:hypothetical protein
MFFLQVKWNRTPLFWQHPTLVPLEGTISHLATNPTPPPSNKDDSEQEPSGDISDEGDDDADSVVDTQPALWAGDGSTHHERLTDTITTIRDFCDGLEYQLQFEDQRMLETLEREGASFLRLVKACLTWERRMNTTRGSSPTTWEQGTSNVMWYRTRPHCEDVDT